MHSQPSTHWVQTMGKRSDSGHSRVSARERPEGCIAEAVALTHGSEKGCGGRGCLRERRDGQRSRNTPWDCFLHDRWALGLTWKRAGWSHIPGEVQSLPRKPRLPKPFFTCPTARPPAQDPLCLSHTHTHAQTHARAHTRIHTRYSLRLGRKQLSAAKLLLVFLLLCLPGC